MFLFFLEKKTRNNGHFWFADMVCLWIVERGKWKVFRRIWYALFYSVSDKAAWASACRVFLGSDGGSRVQFGARLSSVMKRRFRDVSFAANSHRMLLYLIPHQNLTRHSFTCSVKNIFIFITDTESLCMLPETEIFGWKYATNNIFYLQETRSYILFQTLVAETNRTATRYCY